MAAGPAAERPRRGRAAGPGSVTPEPGAHRSLAPRPRRAGLLLHPTSLPGPYGVGDIGPAARDALAWMEAAGFTLWQTLPVHPTDRAGSPYASPSAFARSPMLLSVDDLADEGLLRHAEKPWGTGHPGQVRWADVLIRKGRALDLVADRLRSGTMAAPGEVAAFRARQPWVQDWALFWALSQVHGPAWTRWPAPLRDREPAALARAVDQHADAVERAVALQWLFERQWTRLRTEAHARGVRLMGDVPIFVGGESCDVWAHRHLFRLDDAGLPTVVTGVPPDAFSAEGQCWGTPHYDVPQHARTGYAWWCDRLAATADIFDEIRIDHFRGLAGVWEIPAGAPATEGAWVPSFGAPLLEAIEARLGGLPLVAEDLGIITPDVEALRDRFGLPGMTILQFAFSDARSPGRHPYLPHNHRENQVCYPGTHDNPTTVQWYESADERTRDHLRRYLSTDGRAPAGDLLRAAWRSVAHTAIIAMQDVLALGAEGRMNTPGVPEGNWAWRCTAEAFQVGHARYLLSESRLCGRLGTDGGASERPDGGAG